MAYYVSSYMPIHVFVLPNFRAPIFMYHAQPSVIAYEFVYCIGRTLRVLATAAL